MQVCIDMLDKLGLAREINVLSAHRTPEATHAYVRDADRRGCAVFIAAAGMAAHLAGTVAALTLKPVIGVPIEGGPLKGQDALLSTAMMPGGIPVAVSPSARPARRMPRCWRRRCSRCPTRISRSAYSTSAR